LHSFDETSLSRLFASGWSRFRFAKVQNRAFIALRISSLLRFLPYLIWRTADRLFMLIYPKANTIVVSVRRDPDTADPGN
jgi:hypothetical protein